MPFWSHRHSSQCISRRSDTPRPLQATHRGTAPAGEAAATLAGPEARFGGSWGFWALENHVRFAQCMTTQFAVRLFSLGGQGFQECKGALQDRTLQMILHPFEGRVVFHNGSKTLWSERQGSCNVALEQFGFGESILRQRHVLQNMDLEETFSGAGANGRLCKAQVSSCTPRTILKL